MTLDSSAAGKVYPPQRYEVSREKIREFAEAIGDSNPVYLEADIVPPTFVTIPVMRGTNTLLADLGVELARVVHVDQKFISTRPVRAGDLLETTTVLENVRSLAGNDVLTVRHDVRDDSGADVCTAISTLMIRPEAADA